MFKIMLKGLLVMVAIGLSYELFLRYSPFSLGITPMQYDEHIGMWHKPLFSSVMKKSCFSTSYRFDAQGRVSSAYPYHTQKKDIVLLGDSQIEALMVPNEYVLHNQISKLVNGAANVLNYGLSGTGPTQQLEILKHKVALDNVATLLQFVFIENDLNDGSRTNFDGMNRPKVFVEFETLDQFTVIPPVAYSTKEKLRDFLGHFESYVYLKKTFYHWQQRLQMMQAEQVSTQPKVVEPQVVKAPEHLWLNLKGAIVQTQKLARQYGFNYHVLLYSHDANQLGDYDKMNRLSAFLQAQYIAYDSLLPLFPKEQLSELEYPCDGHWNSQAHEKLAKWLFQHVLSQQANLRLTKKPVEPTIETTINRI